jgi:lysophospholipid acyltransferase (LPLAT)-like uncharacterized protein
MPRAADASVSSPRRRSPSWRRRYKRLRRRLGAVLAPPIAPWLVRALAASWRFQIGNPEHREACRQAPGYLLALWHGRMLLGLRAMSGQGHAVLVSPSDDGALIKPLLEKNGYVVIRGSTSRGGARALREMLATLARGTAVVITPDGPRGPRHAMNPGLAFMASVTGYPVLPVGFGCDRAWRLDSWDAFTIAKPRARVAMVFGAPVSVAAGADDEALERATGAIRAGLFAAERAAFALAVAPIDWTEGDWTGGGWTEGDLTGGDWTGGDWTEGDSTDGGEH